MLMSEAVSVSQIAPAPQTSPVADAVAVCQKRYLRALPVVSPRFSYSAGCNSVAPIIAAAAAAQIAIWSRGAVKVRMTA